MTEPLAHTTPPDVSAPQVEQNEARAWVAEDLLVRPESGITRVQYVGLPEREAVHLLVTGRALGLQAEASRREYGRVSVILAAPAPEARAAGPEGEASGWVRAVSGVLRASGERLAGLLRRRTV